MARRLRAGALGPIGGVQFSQPVRQITLMLVSLALVSVGVYIAFPRVSGIFFANLWLNGFIFLVFLIGVFVAFWQVIQLSSSVRWIEDFAAERPGHQITVAPRLLAPLASLLRSRGKSTTHISSTSARSILESVATRIDEERDITRYIVSLLIFLGLLGTFYGLATSVPAVVETIRSLAPQEGETALTGFGRLMTGLEAQLDGMGVAFSSSLLGLAGSLVVGLLELFAGHGQNRFYRELEEWLSSITRLGSASVEGDGGESGAMGSLAVVLDSMTDQLQLMQTRQAEAETSAQRTEEGLVALAAAVTRLSQRLEGDTASGQALQQIAEGQERLIQLLAGREDVDEPHIEAETRLRLRSMDVQLLRILEELSAGRQETMADLRSDLAGLTQAVRQLGRQPPTVMASRRDDGTGHGG